MNIIPLGDHCAISLILRELELRVQSYPFDWVTHNDQLYHTNILYNVDICNQLTSTNAREIATIYIGNAYKNNQVNLQNGIWFPHEESDETETISKYERRFHRLYEQLEKPNIFILVTRIYFITEEEFSVLYYRLMKRNSQSHIVFISGVSHSYLKKYNNVIFKHIPYDVTLYYQYDYTHFRPTIKMFLKDILIDHPFFS